jgi:Capsular polysaccharide biosynthesis protein
MADFALPLEQEHSSRIAERLNALRNLGVRRVVFATNPISYIEWDRDNRFQADFSVSSVVEGIDAEIIPSYWLDENIEAGVKQFAPKAYRDKYVLFVLRDLNSVRGLKGPLFEVRARGYEPVILHRTPQQFANFKLSAFKYLTDLGCLFHLDLMVLIGVYGQRAKSRAEILLKVGLIRLVTTGISDGIDVDQLITVHLSPNALSGLQQALLHHNALLSEA